MGCQEYRFLLAKIMILCLLFGWSSEAAVNNDRYAANRKDSARKISSVTEKPHAHISMEPYYMSTPQPPMPKRELPKNPYADYVDYYSRS